jgi:hypothetical protein
VSTSTQAPRPTTRPSQAPVGTTSKGMRLTGWAANYIDERTAISGLVR